MKEKIHKENDPEALLREHSAAEFLGYNQRTLQNWRYLKKGPSYITLPNGAIRYKRVDLIGWANKKN